jgi:predicted ATP-grasp superfamily ATP-dependent carboligase
MLEDHSTPIVVLGCFRHGGLGITRSLGRLGVPVYCVDADRWTPAFFSKYCRGTFQWDLHNEPVQESLRFLAELGRKIGRRSVLIPTSDIGAMLVADHAGQLAEWFVFPDRDAALVRSLCSKREMYHLARKWGVATPETAFPQSREEVLRYLDSARFPILLKPIYSGLPTRAAQPIIILHTKDELLERYDAIEDPSSPNLMLQEFVPGGDEMTWTFNGYFNRQGECRVAFTGRKLRNSPPYFGQASLGICVRNDVVEETTIRFMKAIGYRGPLDLGYRYDARDGRYKVNDINPRVGAMFRLFVAANGMDVARALYQDMTGQAVIPASIQEGRKWIVEDCDWLSALRYYRDGNLTLKQWLSSVRGIAETSYVARDDPRPVAAACMRKAIGAFQRTLGSHRGHPDPIATAPPATAPGMMTGLPK